MLKKAIFKYSKKDFDETFSLKEAQNILIDILRDFQLFCDENKIDFSLTYGSLLGAVRDKKIIEWDDDIDLMMSRDNINKLTTVLSKLSKYNLCYYHYSNIKNIYTNEIRIYRKGYYRVLENNGKKYLTPLCIDIFPFDKISILSNEEEIAKQTKILQTITKQKNILILKESKYNSKNFLRGILRGVKKTCYIFITSNYLHKQIDKNIAKLYIDGTDYNYFSPFANESYKLRYDKTIFDNITRIKFGNLLANSINNNENFLTMVYGDWRTPYDRTAGKTKEIVFIKRKEDEGNEDE